MSSSVTERMKIGNFLLRRLEEAGGYARLNGPQYRENPQLRPVATPIGQ